jgi:hypothetical protein
MAPSRRRLSGALQIHGAHRDYIVFTMSRGTDGIALDVLLGLVTEFGLPIEEQAAYFKVAAPPHIIHVAKTKSGIVRRIDMKGFDGVQHPALRRVTRAQAQAAHLGHVTKQLDCEQSKDVVLDALRTCLSRMKPAATSATRPRELPTTAISMRLPVELLAAIEVERQQIEGKSPRGIEVNLTSAIRVLLFEAVEARQKAAKR